MLVTATRSKVLRSSRSRVQVLPLIISTFCVQTFFEVHYANTLSAPVPTPIYDDVLHKRQKIGQGKWVFWDSSTDFYPFNELRCPQAYHRTLPL